MMPIGPLMIEHRLIERMIKQLKERSRAFQKNNAVDTLFIDKAVDFIKIYADRCHHGKEEGILFHDLAKKELQPEHKIVMAELVQEHNWARNATKSLVSAKEKYGQGNKTALSEIVKLMAELADFYPKHIEKEDKHFFIPCMNYFSKQEEESMLKEFREFDRNLVHEKYRMIVEEVEKDIDRIK
jgi:hemerythrin-like domain-containing protein